MLQTIDLRVTDEWFITYKAIVYAFEMICFLISIFYLLTDEQIQLKHLK